MLRRTKEQVALDLPPKQVQVLPLDPHPVHRPHLRPAPAARAAAGAGPARVTRRPTASRSSPRSPGCASSPSTRHSSTTSMPARRPPPRSSSSSTSSRARGRGPPGARLQPVHRLPAHRRGGRSRAAGLHTSYLDGSTQDRQSVVRRLPRGDATAFLISLKAGRLRADADRGRLRLRARPLVEPRGRGTGDRPGAPHRAEPTRSPSTGSSRRARSRRRSSRSRSASATSSSASSTRAVRSPAPSRPTTCATCSESAELTGVCRCSADEREERCLTERPRPLTAADRMRAMRRDGPC